MPKWGDLLSWQLIIQAMWFPVLWKGSLMLITPASSAGRHASVGHTWEVKQKRMNTKCIYLVEGKGSMQLMVVEGDEDRIMRRETVRKPDIIVGMCGLKSTRLLRKTEITGNRNRVGAHTPAKQQCNKRKVNSAGHWGKPNWCLEYRKHEETPLNSKRKTHFGYNDIPSTTSESVLPVMCLCPVGKDSPGDWGLGGTTASRFGEDGRERVISELRWNSLLLTVDH